MSNYLIVTICSHSAAIPAIVGLIHFKRFEKVYQPFLIFLLLGWLNEIVSSITIYYRGSNASHSNIYVLAEFLCILMLFRNWGTRKSRFKVYQVISIIVTAVWLADNVVFHSLSTTNVVYRLCYSLVLVFLSVDQINHVAMMERKNIMKNPKFVICCGLLLFFMFKALMESFFVFELGLSNYFLERFMMIMIVVNVIVKVIYTIAILWMKRKQNFLLRYWQPPVS